MVSQGMTLGVKRNGMAWIAGLLFGLGLGRSQMIDRDRVLAFLDVTGEWDPTLLFVLGGAVGVTLITFRVILRQPHPWFSPAFDLPAKQEVDGRLILGAALFGIGWGIAGYCPGPGIVALILGIGNPLLFLVALVVGSFVTQWVLMTLERQTNP